ncbi:hypothetical protein F5Y05DRAFT_350958 [Hypoxylon sp. FL0543]|nr:hypothetical protein F5Y05DRAFT_350958 [Hypoxylon sp. FL0543]
MDTIPSEILTYILSDLDAPLAPYAGVCRAFQYVIETRTFRQIQIIHGTLPSVRRFDAIFGDKRRRYLLRELEFNIALPNKLKHDRKRPLKYLRDRAFTLALNRLFMCLEKWNCIPEGLERPPSFTLRIRCTTPDVDYGAVHNNHKHLQFDELQSLPTLECVEKLRIQHLQIFPRDMALICGALPCLRDLRWDLGNVPRRLGDLRADLRNSMATALLQTDFSRLETLHIQWIDHDPVNHDWRPETYVDAHGRDHLSIGVNRIMKLPHLKKLYLDGCFILSPEVFDMNCEDVPKSLECLGIESCLVTPAGG